ncbi:MAG: hypothetical protein JSR85_07300 [Proteobacteria bacterium]|nr:hypothetical protein [Pseudomonadota bacterium]
MIKIIRVFIFIFLSGILSEAILEALPSDWPKDKVILLPEMGSTPILVAINSAKKSIDLTLYHLDDPQIIDALIKAKEKGVNVRIIFHKPHLYPSPFENKINEETSEKLKAHGIIPHFLIDHQYTLTHYKFIVIDHDFAVIQTFNYDDFNFKQARNFGLTIEDEKQVTALSRIFENDFTGNSFKNDEDVLNLWSQTNIILGPKEQRKFITDLLKSAKQSVYIYQQDLSDPEIGKVLSMLAKEGKRVEVLMSPEPFGGIDNNRLNQTIITASGGGFRFHPKKELYIHAKVILIDPETDGQMYIGSCNLWPESLSRNRELGIVTRNKPQIDAVYKTFQKDWHTAYGYDEAKARTSALKN